MRDFTCNFHGEFPQYKTGEVTPLKTRDAEAEREEEGPSVVVLIRARTDTFLL